jgi:HTH-type transcriptional regulator / antitoxin HipB
MALILKTPTDIGALIRDRRRVLGLGQAELALKLGASRLWVNQVERGKPGASLGMVLRALAVLGVTLSSELIAQSSSSKQIKGSSSSASTDPIRKIDIDAIVARARTRVPSLPRSKAKKK